MPSPTLELSFQTQIAEIRTYIKDTWKTLTRSHKNILAAVVDPKFLPAQPPPWPIYISAKAHKHSIEQELKKFIRPEAINQIEIRQLPTKSEEIQQQGLLYLPHPYVVPGGRFNEMYGWDSYFTLLGLLRDEEIELAKNMTDNFIYEVEHYGSILNANRTYYLTRSQPPFLTRMILDVFHYTQDKQWLESTINTIESYYKYWTTEPKINLQTGLSRYFDLGEGVSPEVEKSEYSSKTENYYQAVIKQFRLHEEIAGYKIEPYYDRQNHQLTKAFYKGDRSMRESGFDISHRFGPFNLDVINYAPVCLNSLLYQMEIDTAEIYQIINQQTTTQHWLELAQKRQQLINHYLWDETAGLYFDYNFQTQQRRVYEFATIFYPLWTGIASPQQAQKVVNNLSKLEAPGGLLTSPYITHNQWDAPFGWAPLQLIAVQGLRRYGYHQQANRLSQKFISLVIQEFAKHGTILEKYDVVECKSDISADIHFGYTSNEVGFGWTNGVFLELLQIESKVLS